MTGQPSLLDELAPRREVWRTLSRPDWLTKDSAWVVLDRLRYGPACNDDFYATSKTTAVAQRIKDLRDRYGFEVDARPCSRHRHRGATVEYVLIAVPAGVRT